MLTRRTMRGLYALPPTPFDESGNFWESAYRENLRTLVELGVDAVVTPGSNGEWWSMEDDQRRRQMEVLHDECQGKVTTATCGSSTYTDDSIEKTRWAEQIGLDAVMNVPPFYYPLSRDELRRYWHRLAEACPDIGLIAYNFPLVAQRLPEDLQIQLAEEIPTLCGSKESHLDFGVWQKLHRGCDLAVFTAYERGWFTAVFRMGAQGIFSTLVASVPGLITELYAACQTPDWDRADVLEKEMTALVAFLESRDYLQPYNRIAQNKALVNAAGWLQAGRCREPLISVPEALVQQLRLELKAEYSHWLAPVRRRGNSLPETRERVTAIPPESPADRLPG